MKSLINLIFPKACYYAFGVKIPLYFQYSLPALLFYRQIVKLLKKEWVRIVIILIPSIVILIRLLRNDPFFLSDDFAHLRLVSRYSYLEIAKMAFSGGGIWVGHRIIGAFWVFKMIFDLFGPKPELFLLVIFGFHVANVIFFYLLAKNISKNSIFSVLTAFVVGSFYLTWMSNIHEIMAATFLLASTYLFINWLSKKRYLFLSFVFYLLAILTKEITFFLPLALVLLAIYYHFNISPIKTKGILKRLLPFFVVFLIYLLTYAKGFAGYSNEPSSESSYRIVFSLSPTPKHLLYYLTFNFPVIKFSYFGLLIFPTFLLFDLWKKKPVISPFLVSYFIFLGPPLLFENRHSYYYTYIATFFLFLGLTLFLSNVYSQLIKLFQGKAKDILPVFNIYVVLALILGVFGMGKIFMDNCFLIQYPWKNSHKTILLSLIKKIESVGLKDGTIITLNEAEKSPEMEFVYETEVLNVFLAKKEARTYLFSYNRDKGQLTAHIK